jgi:FkbM family methyltransferase
MREKIGLTRLHSSKLRWFFSHEICRKHPLRSCLRLIRWELLRIANGRLNYRYDDNFQITLLPNEGASRLTYYFGVSEPELFRVYNEFLRPRMTIVDAGANIGLHSLFFSKRVGEEGKIYAFEPAKMIFRRMMEHIQNNHVTNIEGLCLALGAKQGSAEIVDNKNDTSRTFLRPSLSNSDTTSTAAVETLDTFAKVRGLEKIDFLKIDVEGFESEILEGALSLLSRQAIKVIQIELDERSLDRAGSEKSAVVSLLIKKGYSLCHWHSPVKGFVRSTKEMYNSFFVAPDVLR